MTESSVTFLQVQEENYGKLTDIMQVNQASHGSHQSEVLRKLEEILSLQRPAVLDMGTEKLELGEELNVKLQSSENYMIRQVCFFF